MNNVDKLYALEARIDELQQKADGLKQEILAQMDAEQVTELHGKRFPIRAIKADRVMTSIDPEVIKQVEWDRIKEAISIKSTVFDKIAKFNPELFQFKKVTGTSSYVRLVK